MNQQFDIFLSHNSKDKTVIREIKQLLLERELSCWLDEDELQPGVNWMPLLEKAIGTCQSAGAFVGSNGIGPWEDEEIQALLTKAVRNKIPVIPVLLPGEYDTPELPLFLGNRTFIDMRSGITPELIDKLSWGITGKKPQPLVKTQSTIHIDRLPTVSGDFFGRKEELQLLDNAILGNETRIIQFIAAGGTGKTKLLRHWLNQHVVDIPNRIVWSFYSQGSAEDKQVSATPFFMEALKTLKAEKTSFSSEEEKGDYLAELLIRHRCLLVLDGLEPLQHVGKGMDGRLKDRAITRLLQKLAAQHTSLCIITTRIRVHDISDRQQVRDWSLNNLQPADGVALLQSLCVKGTLPELDKAVREYGCHALALHLLGNALTTYLDGDVHKRDTLDELLDEYADAGRHAFKVMQAYRDWLQGTPELQLLYLLGLFDHPIETEVLEVLWQTQIPNLTTDLPHRAWLNAIRSLREKHCLLSTHEGRPDLLDCHPLIREYFGGQLQSQQPEAWQKAHEQLYEYYKALPEKLYRKFLPDTLEEMQPLFSAVAHGCAAGLYTQALNEVYWTRITRKKVHYLTRRLGAFNDDLANVAHFFTLPWHMPAECLTEKYKAFLLNEAGFRLRALGRLHEAQEPLLESIDQYIKQEDWRFVAQATSNLSELQLIVGNIKEAKLSGELAMNYADKSRDMFWRMAHHTTYADALVQAGDNASAFIVFQNAEKIQQKMQPNYPYLYSIRGFRYCNLLQDMGEIEEVMKRGKYSLDIALRNSRSLLSIALNQVSIGRGYLQKRDFPQAAQYLEKAVTDLRKSGYLSHWSLGLLARAALHRHTRDFARARQDLQEVFDIADGSGMRLHLTDYHLEMARLLVAEEENPPQSPFCKGGSQEDAGSAVPPFEKGGLGGISLQAHIEAAAKLITATGYHRRDQELADLHALLVLKNSAVL